MKKHFLTCLLLAGIFSSPAVFGQDKEEAKTFNISGSVDAYFHASLNTDQEAPTTSFANLPGFALGMANLIASYQGERAGFTADLVFGPRGEDAVFANLWTDQEIVNQLFAYYKLSDAVTLNLGQFNTFVGYEVISPAVNFHYSTSYMFTNGPFNHTGLRADFDLGGGLGAKLAIMNPTDLVEFNPVKSYTLGGQLGYTNDNGGAWLNFLYGDQDGKLEKVDPGNDQFSQGSTLQVDLTAGFNLSDAIYLGFNGTYRTVAAGEVQTTPGGPVTDAPGDASGFMGVAIYPKVTLSETFALGLRGEYFAVSNNYISPFTLDAEGDGSVIGITLSGNYKVDNLTIIPEIRIDNTSEDSFTEKDSTPPTPTNSMLTFNLAAVYKF
jgi:hypothetical protein